MTHKAPGLDSTLSVQGVNTAAASEERKKLRRSVGRLDTAFLMLAAIIVLDTLGAVSSYGAQTFTWLIVMVIFFLLPYGLLTAELGSTFAEEGGPYVWVKLAFGRAAAAVVSVMYWVDNPIWLAGTLAITAMATFSTFSLDIQRWPQRSLRWRAHGRHAGDAGLGGAGLDDSGHDPAMFADLPVPGEPQLLVGR